MRRLLSILLLLVLGLGPAGAEIPGFGPASGWTGKVDESRLPVCCRRHGQHHCELGAAAADGTVFVSAKSDCPFMPRALACSTSNAAAPAAGLAAPLAVVVALRSLGAGRAAAFANERRAWPKRGPPVSIPV